jgi:cytochrome b
MTLSSSSDRAVRRGAAGSTADPARPRTLVWDAPVRIGHWLMVLCFAGAWLTAESERWQLAHLTLGYTMGGLVAFRIAWGLIGTRHARFASFIRGPQAVVAYLRSLLAGTPQHHTGHNPAGALSVVALLLLAIAVTFSGWAADGGPDHWLKEVHEAAASVMLAMVMLHVAAVAVSSWLHRENLVRGMVNGRKHARPGDGIKRAWRSVGALMLVAVLGFWWLQSTTPNLDAGATGLHAGWRTMADHDDGDD